MYQNKQAIESSPPMLFKDTKPSNIALIKYMGKADFRTHQACNPSLSYTLPGFTSTVTLRVAATARDHFMTHNTLSEKAQKRFLKHLQFIKDTLQYKGFFEVDSSNSFPSSCGLASSASSFAALTACALKAIATCTGQQGLLEMSFEEQALMSQRGSGSSCRSFFAPWALWDQRGARSIELPYQQLKHHVVVVSDLQKEVSSSEAHQRVLESFIFLSFKGKTIAGQPRKTACSPHNIHFPDADVLKFTITLHL